MSQFPHMSLDGTWSFTTDPHERGERDGWYQRTSGFGRQVAVPSAWQLYGRDLLHYTGSAWYYRACEIPADWAGRRVRLHVGASDYLTRAWLNGQLVGEHEGGYTPFAFDLTEHARPGEINHLVVRVYDPNDYAEIPHGQQGSHFTRVSGIWQSVRLEARAAVHIEQLSPRTWLNPDRVEAEATLNQALDGQLVRFLLRDHAGEMVASAEAVSEAGVARVKLELGQARRWSPDQPYLYTLSASVGDGPEADVVSTPVGLRQIDAIDGRIYLNGQLLILRGASDQGYWPETLYAAPSDEEIQRELRLAKEAGVNVLRKHGKIEDPRYLDWCDRLGMLVWVEAPSCDRWTPQSRQRFLNDVRAMVKRDAFRPCVIAWSLYQNNRGLAGAGNEMQPWLRQVHDEIAAADPTRPICTHSGGSSMRTDMIDEHRRYGMPEESRELAAALAGELPAAGAPRLVSEFGQWGLPAEPTELNGERWWLLEGYTPSADEAKNPLTAERNFERYKLANVFEDLDNLAMLTQRRMTRGVKALIEAFRRQPAFAGYVARSLYDTEWDCSGWLTYDRKPKLGFDEWATFNAPIVVLAELPRHNYWAGETVEATVYLSNHSKNPIKGLVHWGIDGADCDGELEVDVAAFTTAPVGTIRFEAPAFPKPQATKLSLRLSSSGWDINTNYQELTISPREAGLVPGRRVAVMYLGAELKERLAAQGYEVSDVWEPGMTLLTGSLERDVQQALDQGAHAVFLAERGARTPNVGFLSFRALPLEGVSAARSRSVNSIQWDLFPQLPLNTLMGWEMEDLAPHHVIPLGLYMADGQPVMSNQAEEDPANVLAGYFEGWLGHFSASMLVQSVSRGRLLTTTLRLGSHYGEHPMATLLLNRLLTEAHLFELRTVYQLET